MNWAPWLEHLELTRRHFLSIGGAGIASAAMTSLKAQAAGSSSELEAAIRDLNYLTPQADFGTVERGNPLPYTLPEPELRAAGLVPETWRLEIVADETTDGPKPKIENPLSKELGTALDWDGLMRLAERHAVRFPKIITCNNGAAPLGMGIWEGVPLREVVWLTKPTENVRRVFYHGYHNNDPKQLFQSSLPIGRVLEDPPDMPPVILCYKLNGEFLSGKRGGPVRMLVPETYGFKSVKWLNRVTLTNLFHANDTYAGGNNDVDSWMKTFARFVSHPERIKAAEPVPITGMAQVGISGLKAVQVCVTPQSTELTADDPYFTKGDWQGAEILGPPAQWGGGLPEGKLPLPVNGFDADTGKPQTWPMRYAMAHWAVLLPGLPPGTHDVRCRTIDANGIAQPLPRPFAKSGRNAIQRVVLIVEA